MTTPRVDFTVGKITMETDIPEAVQTYCREALKVRETNRYVFSGRAMLELFKQELLTDNFLAVDAIGRAEGAAWLDRIMDQYTGRDAADLGEWIEFAIELVEICLPPFSTRDINTVPVHFRVSRYCREKDVPEAVQTFFEDVLRVKDEDGYEGDEKYVLSSLEDCRNDFAECVDLGFSDNDKVLGIAWFDRILADHTGGGENGRNVEFRLQ